MKKKYKCSKCGEKFNSPGAVYGHFRNAHPGEKSPRSQHDATLKMRRNSVRGNASHLFPREVVSRLETALTDALHTPGEAKLNEFMAKMKEVAKVKDYAERSAGMVERLFEVPDVPAE